MKLFTSALIAALTSSATANPFAPKKSAATKQAAYNSALMRGATPIRRLEDAYDGEVDIDLSTYSVKFEKCQFVKQYAGGNGNNKNNNNKNGNGVDTILATKRFVVFRMCPSGCDSCSYNYGEYIVDMDTYLEATLEFMQQKQENYCQTCNECVEKAANGENDDAVQYMCANVDTSSCYDECQNIENMEANGYLDAAQYTGCVKLGQNENNGAVYYAGAMCASSGTRIKIGVFADEQCSQYVEDADVETYINTYANNNNNNNGASMKLSYHLLKQTFPEGECVASCLKQNQNNNNNNGDQAAEVSEVCEQLYEKAGKCESTHGFNNGYIANNNYNNQVQNEALVCDFISSVSAGHYDQTGEIVISGGRTTLSGSMSTSGGQKFALTFFILGSVGLAGYAALLHQQLTKGAKADLSRQGGAMA